MHAGRMESLMMEESSFVGQQGAADWSPRHAFEQWMSSSPLHCMMGVLLRWLERESFADRAWAPIRGLALAPQGSLALVAGVYVVYVILWAMFFPVASVVGEMGTWLLILYGVRRIGGIIARFATFPGSFRSVRHDVEREYARRLASKLDECARSIEAWWLDLHPRAPREDADRDNLGRRCDEALRWRNDVLIPLRDAMRATKFKTSASTTIGDDGDDDDKKNTRPKGAADDKKKKKKNSNVPSLVNPRPLSWGDVGSMDWKLLSARASQNFDDVFAAIDRVVGACEEAERLTKRLLAAPQFTQARRAIGDNAADSRIVCDLATACRDLGRSPPLVAPVVTPVRPPAESADHRGERPRIITEALHAAKVALRAPCPAPLDTAFGLDLLRAELARSYGASQFWLKDGASVIDCCVVPPFFDRGSSLLAIIRPLPTVLFCAPNAVVYESFAMAPRDGKGWVAAYARKGLQVVVWNLRGYGRTPGSPSPSANGRDAEALAKKIMSAGVPKLLIHGESIGGMVATRLAATLGDAARKVLPHPPNDDDVLEDDEEAPLARPTTGGSSSSSSSTITTQIYLVADRTFANLPVEAQYLTGISAVAYALPLVTGWLGSETNSVLNFLAAKCPKLVAADACDHMIPDQASLKAGLAIGAELGDFAPRRLDLPGPLAVSEALREAPALPYRRDLLPTLVAPRNNMSGTKAQKQEKTPPPQEKHNNWRLTNESIAHFAACARYVGRRAAQKYHDDGQRPLMQKERVDFEDDDATEDQSEEESTDEEDGRVGIGGGRAPRRRRSKKNSTPKIRRQQKQRGSYPDLRIKKNVPNVATDEKVPRPCLKHSSSSLESIDMGDDDIYETVEVRAWRLLERVDGGCGQALGRALAADLGAVRAWVCTYATWPNGAPNKLIDGLIDSWGDVDAGDDDDDDSAFDDDGIQGDDDEEHRSLGVSEAAAALAALVAPRVNGEDPPLLDSLRFVADFLDALARRATTTAASRLPDDSNGSLLVLGCGHNAPYAPREKDAIWAWLRAVGFVDDVLTSPS